MKELISKVLFWMAGFFGAIFLRLLGRMVRIEEVNRSILNNLKNRYGRVIFAIYHGQILLGIYMAKDEDVVSIISQHRDGEIIYRIASRLGIKAVRGSSTRGGTAALFELSGSPRYSKDSIVITPDGPRGPRGSVKRGIILQARRTGLPIVPIAIVSSSSWEFNSWDRFQLPQPFSRTVVRFGPPVMVQRDSEDEEIEIKRKELEKGLHDLNIEAMENLSGGESGSRYNVLLETTRDYLRKAVSLYIGREREMWWSFVLTVILYPCELIFRISVALRNYLYSSGSININRLPIPVVSVGNISVGGTGKTMFVMALSRILTGRGLKVCVLTRGYGGHNRPDPEIVPANVRNREIALELGDEPVLLAQNLPECLVIRGRDRYLSGLKAAAHYGCDICVLDDGFQFRELYRDLDIVMLHGENPFGTGFLLPAGNLRERPSSLRRADLIVECRRWGNTPNAGNGERRVPPGIPRIRTSIVPCNTYLLGSSSVSKAVDCIEGKKVLAFAGIGDPGSLRYLIDNCSPGRVSYLFFPDHFNYDDKSVEKLNRIFDSMDADIMVTTEKDAVKLRPDGFSDRPCFVISAEMKIDEGEEVIEELFVLLGGGSVGDLTSGFVGA
jgi:tetraacyldisaccharide 4'-kinase